MPPSTSTGRCSSSTERCSGTTSGTRASTRSPTYSLLYYLPAALVGNAPLVFGAAVVSTLLFASIARQEWGQAALWPTRIFAVCAAAPLFTGLYSYSFGFMLMLGAVRALQARRTWTRDRARRPDARLQRARVPVSLPAARVRARGRRRVSAASVRIGVALVVIAAFELFVLQAVSEPGRLSVPPRQPRRAWSPSRRSGSCLARRARTGRRSSRSSPSGPPGASSSRSSARRSATTGHV